MKRKTYYAHAMCIYGHLVESQELAAIRRRFKGSVVNPAKYDDDPEKRRDTIGFCLRLIERCDAIVFSKLLGKITAGVGKEINHALKLKSPCTNFATVRCRDESGPCDTYHDRARLHSTGNGGRYI